MQLPESAHGSDKQPLSAGTLAGFWVLFFPKCVVCPVSACFSPDMGGIRFLETLDFISVSVLSSCFLLFDLRSSVSFLFLFVSFQLSGCFSITSRFAVPSLFSKKKNCIHSKFQAKSITTVHLLEPHLKNLVKIT